MPKDGFCRCVLCFLEDRVSEARKGNATPRERLSVFFVCFSFLLLICGFARVGWGTAVCVLKIHQEDYRFALAAFFLLSFLFVALLGDALRCVAPHFGVDHK